MYPIIAKIIRIVIAITCPNSTKKKYSVNTRSFIINNKRNKININKKVGLIGNMIFPPPSFILTIIRGC